MGDASRISLFLAAAVVPALSEETLFRGVFLNTLRIRHSFWASITVSAAIFAVVHFDPAHLLELFLLGSYLALLALVSRSLWVPIVFHLLNNGLALLTFASMQPFGKVEPLPIEWWLPLIIGFAGSHRDSIMLMIGFPCLWCPKRILLLPLRNETASGASGNAAEQCAEQAGCQ